MAADSVDFRRNGPDRRAPARALRRQQPHRERLELVDECRFDVFGRAGDLDRGVARERLLDQYPQLQARERGTEAEVPSAGAEGLMLGGAPQVEAVDVFVARLVAVG